MCIADHTTSVSLGYGNTVATAAAAPPAEREFVRRICSAAKELVIDYRHSPEAAVGAGEDILLSTPMPCLRSAALCTARLDAVARLLVCNPLIGTVRISGPETTLATLAEAPIDAALAAELARARGAGNGRGYDLYLRGF